jgi:hypothetical protein
MTYRARVPRQWRKIQEEAAYTEARNQRAWARLKRRRWRLLRHLAKRTLFWLFFALVIIAAAICGLTIGGLAATRRRRRY